MNFHSLDYSIVLLQLKGELKKVAYMEKYHLSPHRGGDYVLIKETQENVGEGKMERHLPMK